LNHNENGNIQSSHLTQADLAARPEKVLNEILDVPITVPVWVEEDVRSILRKYKDLPDNEDKINKLFIELKSLGLTDAISSIPIDDDEI
jgi:ketopantoate reductase